jgi:hypothetical protein
MGAWHGLLVLALGAAQGQAPAEVPRPKPTASPASRSPAARTVPAPSVVEGTVKGPEGKPVEGALVIVEVVALRFGRQAPLTARTDSSGRFRIELERRGPLNLRVEAKGLAPRTLEKVTPGSPLAIALAKGRVIEGVVREAASGRAVPKARVRAVEQDPGITLPGWEAGAGSVEAAADARGSFRLEGLGLRLARLTASAPGVGYGTKDDVRPGARVELLLLPGGSISGTVLGPGGKPIEGAVVRPERESRGSWLAGRAEKTDAAGRFEIVGLDPGPYALVARHADHGVGVTAGITLERDAESSADVVLAPGVPVTGRLVAANERLVPGQISVQELNGELAPRALVELLRTEAGADGRFRLAAVPPGAYVLAVVASGYAGKRVEMNVGPRATSVNLGDVVLETGLTIRGRVRDKAGVGIKDAQLHASAPRLRGLPLDTQSEADGSYVLAGLDPGPYRVSVLALGHAASGRSIDAGAENADFVLAAGGSVVGVVVDDAGKAVEAYEVQAQPTQESLGYYAGGDTRSVADADGRFTLEDLNEGTYVVEVSAPDLAPSSVSGVKVAAGRATDVGRVRLQKGGIVRGVVVDAGGGAVAAATVTVLGPGQPWAQLRRPEATTDGAGSFEVRGVPTGRAVATATHPSYAPARVSDLDVDPARGPTETRLELAHGGRIEGVARKRDGTPLAGVQVRWSPLRPDGHPFEHRAPVPAGVDGTFVLEHVAPGRAALTLFSSPVPGRLTSVQQREVDVREGETSAVEFVVRDILVTGHVARNGAPASNMRLRFSGSSGTAYMSYAGRGDGVPAPSSGPQRMLGITREDGGFELIVDEPGEFRVLVTSLDEQLRLPWRTVTVPDADTHNVELGFSGVPVSGVVVERETRCPIPQADVWVAMKPPSSGSGGASDPEGRFQLELEPGEYRLRAMADGYAEASTSVSVPSEGVSDVRLELSKGSSLSGKVLDQRGQALLGIAVLAVTEGAEGSQSFAGGDTLSDGSFRLDGLAIKPYNLCAGSALGGFAVRAAVAPGTQDVVLTLGPPGRLRPRAVGSDGAPVAGAHPRIRRLDGVAVVVPLRGPTATDAQGYADLVAPAGRAEVEVGTLKLKGTVTVDISAEGGVVTTVMLREEPGATH